MMDDTVCQTTLKNAWVGVGYTLQNSSGLGWVRGSKHLRWMGQNLTKCRILDFLTLPMQHVLNVPYAFFRTPHPVWIPALVSARWCASTLDNFLRLHLFLITVIGRRIFFFKTIVFANCWEFSAFPLESFPLQHIKKLFLCNQFIKNLRFV